LHLTIILTHMDARTHAQVSARTWYTIANNTLGIKGQTQIATMNQCILQHGAAAWCIGFLKIKGQWVTILGGIIPYHFEHSRSIKNF
jgi:hypothetical protein